MKKPDPIDVNMACILKSIRCWRQISQENLGLSVGLKASDIDDFENAKKQIPASTLYRMACELDIHLIDFFVGLTNISPSMPKTP